MIEWRFRNWYNVKPRPLLCKDYTEQWKTVQEEGKEWQRSQESQQESMEVMISIAELSLLKAKAILLWQDFKKVKFLTIKNRQRNS
jgi:hypothetical protein